MESLHASSPPYTRLDALTTGYYPLDMIAERLPQLAAMSRDQKWLVFRELEEELAADDSTETPAGKAAVIEILEQRWQNYVTDPGSATTWGKVKERMHAYRAQRRAAEA